VVLSLLLGVALAGCAEEPQPNPKTATKPAASASPSLAVTETSLGLPFYPGAKVAGGRSQGNLANADLETSDPPEKAVGFYANVLGVKASWKGPVTWLEGKKGEFKYAITVTAEKGKPTEIAIMAERQDVP